ncbi:hypothetical protein TNCV_3597941 [Trichonephila clavipes]|nr:hypothetical protein TNCV_3597941 [Trichonephila clavipes]
MFEVLSSSWERSTQAFISPALGRKNVYRACFITQTLEVLLQTDHLIGTSAHAPQCRMVPYTERVTVGPDLHGLLYH